MTKFYRSKDLRERYGCSDPSLYRWTKAGKLPQPQFINGQRIWTEKQIEAADAALISDDRGAA